MQWENLVSFHMWCQKKECAHAIELITSSTVSGRHLWLQKHIYVCACQLSNDPNKYKKIFPQCFQKIGIKKTGCHCRIVIKWYYYIPIVLECYIDTHNYNLGLGNIAYMQLSCAAQETKVILVQQVDQRTIVHDYLIIYIHIWFTYGIGPACQELGVNQ